jgi:hypothetical protein
LRIRFVKLRGTELRNGERLILFPNGASPSHVDEDWQISMRSTKTNLAKTISADARLDYLDILARYFLTSNKLFEELRLEFVHFGSSRVEIRIPFNGQWSV